MDDRWLVLLLLLLLFQEVDNEVLVFSDEIISQALRFQIVSEMLSPLRIEGL